MRQTNLDPYTATAGMYDLANSPYRPVQEQAVLLALAGFEPSAGPVLDIGAGSGLNTELLLQRWPAATVLACEPSAAMRSLLLQRVAGRPDWWDRVTVRPEQVQDVPLPPRLAAVVALGVLGHFEATQRVTLLAMLGRLLAPTGVVVLDLQDPQIPTPVPTFEIDGPRIGALRYSTVGEAWPDPGHDERMRWRMSYRTWENERLVEETTTEHIYHHPAADRVAQEADRAGLTLERLEGVTGFWTLRQA